MEYAWFGVGVIVGVPLGWLLLAVGFVRWTVHAAEEGDSAPPGRRGSAADRKKL